jgi:hypothetical protein
MPEVVAVEPDGSVEYRQQYVGPLSQPLQLADFPLDTQQCAIHFAATGYRSEELEFVPERVPGAEHLTGGGVAELLSVPDWDVTGYRTEVRPLEVSDTVRTAGFALEFTARRRSAYYIWHAALPLTLIVMMSWAPFWIDPEKAELRFGIASSAVLTLIACRFLLASLLPKLPYLTRMDYLTLSSTVLVFLSFLQVLLTSLLAARGRAERARRVGRWCRVVFPVAFIASLGASPFA